MKCPECKSFKTKVLRTESVGNITRRERICLFCNSRFTTIEAVEGIVKITQVNKFELENERKTQNIHKRISH